MNKIIESEAKVTANDFWRHIKRDAGNVKIFSVPSTAAASSVSRVVNCRCGHRQPSPTRETEVVSIAPSGPVQTATQGGKPVSKLKQTLGIKPEESSPFTEKRHGNKILSFVEEDDSTGNKQRAAFFLSGTGLGPETIEIRPINNQPGWRNPRSGMGGGAGTENIGSELVDKGVCGKAKEHFAVGMKDGGARWRREGYDSWNVGAQIRNIPRRASQIWSACEGRTQSREGRERWTLYSFFGRPPVKDAGEARNKTRALTWSERNHEEDVADFPTPAASSLADVKKQHSGLDRRDNICKPLSEENAKAEAWLQEKQQQKPLVKGTTFRDFETMSPIQAYLDVENVKIPTDYDVELVWVMIQRDLESLGVFDEFILDVVVAQARRLSSEVHAFFSLTPHPQRVVYHCLHSDDEKKV
ncbi:hypothetical protein F2Q69_00039701 [Brassica cretica]|uniref:Uncharacterized protein n=1 Tax=Brassica cretica TaxID=69181 RepID=A0A8S9NUS6_BRACR|nr:hypothetical protein F2Q69_00039701 [Brassica cretica]